MGGSGAGVSTRHSAIRSLSEASAGFASRSKAFASERARRLSSAKSPRQRQIRSGLRPMID
jgi:hypothetical protein